MQNLKSYWTLGLLLILLQGCVGLGGPTPETVNERLAAAEISYQEVIKTATLYRQQGQLSQSQIESIDDAFDQYEKARDAARAALQLADIATADEKAGQVAKVLQSIRNILAEVAQ